MPPYDKLGNHSGYAENKYTHQIDKQEGGTAVLSCQSKNDAYLSSKATTFRHKQ